MLYQLNLLTSEEVVSNTPKCFIKNPVVKVYGDILQIKGDNLETPITAMLCIGNEVTTFDKVKMFFKSLF